VPRYSCAASWTVPALLTKCSSRIRSRGIPCESRMILVPTLDEILVHVFVPPSRVSHRRILQRLDRFLGNRERPKQTASHSGSITVFGSIPEKPVAPRSVCVLAAQDHCRRAEARS
jgi:hypothetical protein